MPTEEAAAIALRTQQLIAYESGVTQTVDPLAGSYFVESLTDEIEAEAQKYLDKIDELGGSVDAIEQGYMQNEIANAAYEYQKAVESGEQIIVGVNKFTNNESVNPEVFRVDDSIRIEQSLKLEKLKETRNNQKVNLALSNLKKAAKGNDNLMPFILVAVEEYATLGEIADVLREVFGEY